MELLAELLLRVRTNNQSDSRRLESYVDNKCNVVLNQCILKGKSNPELFIKL